MLNQSRDPPHIRESAHLWKLNYSQNSGQLRPPRETISSIKTNYDVFTYLFILGD